MGEILFLLVIGLAIFISIVVQILSGEDEPRRKKDDYLLLPIKNFGPGPPWYSLPIEREAVEGKSDDEDKG